MKALFWKQAGYYFSLYSVLGIVSPYLGYWLSNSVEREAIKYVLGAFYLTMIFVPAMWGYFAFSPNRDGTIKPGQWLAFGSLGAAIFSLGLTQIESTTPILTACFLVLAFGIFFNALVTLIESISFTIINNPSDFSKVRVFGSIGFLACSVSIGGNVILEKPETFPYVLSAIMFLTWAQSIYFKKICIPINSETNEIKEDRGLIKDIKRLWALWGSILFNQAGFACYFAFFAIYLKSLGFSGIQIGTLIGIAAGAEILMFLKIDVLLKKLSEKTLISISVLFMIIRWTVLFFIENQNYFILVLLMQLTQAFGFSVFHVSSLNIIKRNVSIEHFASAKGFAEAIGFGLGGLIGVICASYIWENNEQKYVFLIAAIFAFTSLLSSLLISNKQKFNQGQQLILF